MSTNAFARFDHLWNGSEPGWVVVRHREDLEELDVGFSDNGPTTQELMLLRTVAPTLEVVRLLKGARSFHLGTFESAPARRLRAQCESVGLRVASHGYTSTRYSLINEQTSRFLLIEDSATLRCVAEEAMSRGLPVRESAA
jgi:hypothetical protein